MQIYKSGSGTQTRLQLQFKHVQMFNVLCYCQCQMGIAHTPRSLARNAPILGFTRDDDAAWTTKLLDAKLGWKRSQLAFACSLVALDLMVSVCCGMFTVVVESSCNLHSTRIKCPVMLTIIPNGTKRLCWQF